MILLDIVPWALDIGWQVEVMLHEGFVEEGFSHLKPVRSCCSVNSEDIVFIELLHQSLRLESSISGRWLLFEVEVTLADLIRSFPGVYHNILAILSDVLAEEVHRSGCTDRSHVECLSGVHHILQSLQTVVLMHFDVVVV